MNILMEVYGRNFVKNDGRPNVPWWDPYKILNYHRLYDDITSRN